MESYNIFQPIIDRLQLIVFDLDGTLVDSSIPMGDAFNYTIEQLGFEKYNKDETDLLIGTPLSEVFMNVLGKTERDSEIDDCINICRNKYKEICCDNSKLYDGVAELILKLAGVYTISLATTKNTEISKLTLKHFKILDYFSLVIGSDQVTEAKPSPEIINKTLAELNVERTNAMIVGDSMFDLNAGRAAGISTCIVTYGFADTEELKRNNPDFLIDDFRKLELLLKE